MFRFARILLGQKNPYSRIFVAVILNTVIAIFLTSSFLYKSLETRMFSIMHNNAQTYFAQSNNLIKKYLGELRQKVLQIYLDPVIMRLFRWQIPTGFDMVESLKKLQYYKVNTPDAHSIEVFNLRNNHFYATYGMGALDGNTTPQKGDALALGLSAEKSFIVIPRKFRDRLMAASENVYSLVVNDRNLSSGETNIILLFNLKEEALSSLLHYDLQDVRTSIGAIDSKGKVTIKFSRYQVGEDLSHEKYVKEILSNSAGSSYARLKIANEDLFLTYFYSEELHWYFLKTLPYSTIARQINQIRLVTYLVTLLILVFALLFAFIVTRFALSPVKQIQLRLKGIEKELQDRQYEIKEKQLMRLFYADEHMDVEELRKDFSKFRINLVLQSSLYLILYRIDHYYDFCEHYNKYEQFLIKKVLGEKIKEQFSKDYHTDFCILENDSLLLLLESKSASSLAVEDSVTSLVREIESSKIKIRDIVPVSVSVTMSRRIDDVRNTSAAYEEMLRTSHLRFLEGHNSLTFVEHNHSKDSGLVDFPLDVERKLYESILSCHFEKARFFYRAIIHELTRSFQYQHFQAYISRLAITINNAVKELTKNYGIELKGGMLISMEKMLRFETLEDIDIYIFQVLSFIKNLAAEKQSKKHANLIARVIEYIEEELPNPQLNLTIVSEKFLKSPNYINKLFVRLNGSSIPSYILSKRLEAARRLIMESHSPIHDLAESAGFANINYFFTVFKKKYGLTPNEFRMQGISKTN